MFRAIAKTRKTEALGVLYEILGPPHWIKIKSSDDVLKILVVRAGLTENLPALENFGLERFFQVTNTVNSAKGKSNTKAKKYRRTSKR